VTTKYIAAADSAVCATGAAITAVTSTASLGLNAIPHPKPVVFGAPLPPGTRGAVSPGGRIPSARGGHPFPDVPFVSKGAATGALSPALAMTDLAHS
jgi:hypothetical protein